eukprot:5143591-Amphidinium_carterae.1
MLKDEFGFGFSNQSVVIGCHSWVLSADRRLCATTGMTAGSAVVGLEEGLIHMNVLRLQLEVAACTARPPQAKTSIGG